MVDPARRQSVAEFAEGLVKLGGIGSPPVEPGDLLHEEPVSVFAEDFGEAFDGLLEFDRGLRHFGLYYNTYGRGTRWGRSRFSLAHEVGHYFLDEHRRYLVSGGNPHYSRAAFQADSDIEREADIFAANLLMPHHMLKGRFDEPDIGTVIRLAGEFQTSLLASAHRFVEATRHACTLVVSLDGRVSYSTHSEEMAARGWMFVETGVSLPPGKEKTCPGLASPADAIDGIEERETSTHEWTRSPRGRDTKLWMQTLRQAKYGRAITLLIHEPDPWEDQDEE